MNAYEKTAIELITAAQLASRLALKLVEAASIASELGKCDGKFYESVKPRLVINNDADTVVIKGE